MLSYINLIYIEYTSEDWKILGEGTKRDNKYFYDFNSKSKA